MPPGTPPDKVLGAVRNFAREEFWGQHRYAFVLHTDEAHPHVHLVLKAVNEQGVRLNIKKATLRHWRSEFARNLRLLGVEANATERAVRGEGRKAKKDGIYRASLRGDSTYVRAQAEAVAAELLKGHNSVRNRHKANSQRHGARSKAAGTPSSICSPQTVSMILQTTSKDSSREWSRRARNENGLHTSCASTSVIPTSAISTARDSQRPATHPKCVRLDLKSRTEPLSESGRASESYLTGHAALIEKSPAVTRVLSKILARHAL